MHRNTLAVALLGSSYQGAPRTHSHSKIPIPAREEVGVKDSDGQTRHFQRVNGCHILL